MNLSSMHDSSNGAQPKTMTFTVTVNTAIQPQRARGLDRGHTTPFAYLSAVFGSAACSSTVVQVRQLK